MNKNIFIDFTKSLMFYIIVKPVYLCLIQNEDDKVNDDD